jgi:hypothetical protein
VQEAQPAEAPTEEPARPEESEGAARERLLEHVVALRQELGYDTATRLRARSKAAAHSDEVIRPKDIPSLDRLIEAQRVVLGQKVKAEQVAGSVGANGGNGRALDACTLSELRRVAESLEIQ